MKQDGTSLSDERYFHRIRIGRLGFDISFTGWVKDIHTKISVSPFIFTKRLSTWTKLMETLGYHCAKEVLWPRGQYPNPSNLESVFTSKKKKKTFANLDDTAKRQRLLFGKQQKLKMSREKDGQWIDKEGDTANIPDDAIAIIEVSFDTRWLMGILTSNSDYYDEHEVDDAALEEIFRESLMKQFLHDRVLAELKTVLEEVFRGNMSELFQFEMIKRLEMNHWKMKIAMRQIGSGDEVEMDKLDLIDKYRISLQNLIVGKRDQRHQVSGSKMSSVAKFLYNANNITVQPRTSRISE